ncbi:unnamed protein product [Linum tenue]|uniref:Uncharacterized protein n=1 Tax=Linum tenue TaxID=586396 RepID=A0AAV0LHV6_9ROSI|nr:unnamed protein product [Linum tenue]
MGSARLTSVLLLVAIVLGLSCRHIATARPLLETEQQQQRALIIQSLQRGPVPPSKSSPCGHVPGRGSGRCPLNEMNVAGSGLFGVRPHPAPAGDVVVAMEVAPVAKAN